MIIIGICLSVGIVIGSMISNYCWKKEIKKFLKNHEEKDNFW